MKRTAAGIVVAMALLGGCSAERPADYDAGGPAHTPPPDVYDSRTKPWPTPSKPSSSRAPSSSSVGAMPQDLAAQGFKDAGSGLGWKWTTGRDDAEPCPAFGQGCATAQIVAYEPCSSVYIEVNFLADDVIVGRANDSVRAMSEGDRADLMFVRTEGPSSATTVRRVELTCH